MNAYTVANLQKVFVENRVVQPESWYGHAPVYPWTTLGILSPLAALPMVASTYVFTILSVVSLAIAIAALMRYAAANFDLGLGWRIGICVLCVCGPLLSFGLDMGNVSVLVCALCILAFVLRHSGFSSRWREWTSSGALALALLLKPHVSLWCALGMFLLSERAARRVVLRAMAAVAAFTLFAAGALALMGRLGAQTYGYLSMLSAENSAGASMSAVSRDALPVVAQITSLQSVLGFWIVNPIARNVFACVLLLLLVALLARQTRQVDTERGALLAIGAWCSFGMLATYHRAHDGVALLILVPWAVALIRRRVFTWPVWVASALYCAMSASADFPKVVQWISSLPPNSLGAFVLLRQVALANLLLFVTLLVSLPSERARSDADTRKILGLNEIRSAA